MPRSKKRVELSDEIISLTADDHGATIEELLRRIPVDPTVTQEEVDALAETDEEIEAADEEEQRARRAERALRKRGRSDDLERACGRDPGEPS